MATIPDEELNKVIRLLEDTARYYGRILNQFKGNLCYTAAQSLKGYLGKDENNATS